MGIFIWVDFHIITLLNLPYFYKQNAEGSGLPLGIIKLIQMMNNIILGYKDSHNEPNGNEFAKKFMTSLEISETTGRRHDSVLRDIRKLLSKGVAAHNFVESFYTDKSNKKCPCYKLTQKGCLILASGYNPLLREKIIDRWESLETGKALPVYQVNSTHVQQVLPLKEQLSWAKEVKKLLNLSDSSTLRMLQKIAKPYGNQLPLPDYTPSKGITKSATALLRENGIDLSARKFNERLLKEGFLRKVERKSSKGIKSFLNLTDKGLTYGENVVSPHNPNETQPHFYQKSFGDLLSLLNIQKSGALFNEN